MIKKYNWQTKQDAKVIRQERQIAREIRKSQWWKNRRASNIFKQPSGITTVKIHKSGRRALPCDNPKEINEEHYKTGTEPVLDMSIPESCGQEVTEKVKNKDSDPEL